MGKDSRRVWTAAGLHFFAVAGVVLARTYVDLLFLSTYPNAWLPYFFMGQTAVILLLTFGVTPLLSKGSHINNCVILVATALSVAASRFLLPYGITGFPFALTLWLAALSVLLGVISWNAVGDAFDTRQFKQNVRWISAGGSLGGLVVGLAVPVLLSSFKAEALLYLLTGLIGLSAALVLGLKPLGVGAKKSKKGGSALKYPLFRNLAIGVLLLMVVDTFADYAIKSEVGAAFSKEGIGTFMGPFYGISNALTLVVQFAGTNILLRSFGIAGLLAVVPGFCLLANVGLAAHPGLWMAAFFRMGEIVFRYSVDNVGREIAANPLPGQIRRAGKLFLKGVATPVGTGVGAILLWLVAGHIGLRGIGLISVAVCAVWLVLGRKTTKNYQAALEEAVRTRRFGAAAEETMESALESARAVALHALGQKDPDAVRFGLGLLKNLELEKLPPEALRLLDSDAADIRAAVAKAVGDLGDKDAVVPLAGKLKGERDPEVLWRILEALSVLDPDSAVPDAKKLLGSSSPDVRAGAILVLVEAGDLDALLEAGGMLKSMIRSGDAGMRRGAARVLSSLKAGKPEKELAALLDDPDDDVCITAVRAAGYRQATGLAGELAAKLGRRRVSRYASRALAEMGAPAIPHLLETVRRGKRNEVRMALRSLALIPGAEAEDALGEAARCDRVITRTVAAKESALRARRQPVTAAFRESARLFVGEEARILGVLGSAGAAGSLPEHVGAEISARRILAKTRLLHWFAVCTQPADVLDAMPALLSRDDSQAASARRATAIELLDSLAANGSLKDSLSALEAAAPAGQDGDPLARLKDLDDPWLKGFVDAECREYGGGAMDDTQKVMLLRKVRLFESLPGETLLTVAEESELRDMAEGERIFAKGSAPDGLYIVASGTVKIQHDGQVITELKECDFFGEVGLLDGSARTGDAVAGSSGTLLFIEREVFDSITEDLPEVMRAVVKTVIGYLGKK
ncbi:MAG: cyclic nucleotide-binding domain-containing protein [Elusimicrobiota bacterium]